MSVDRHYPRRGLDRDTSWDFSPSLKVGDTVRCCWPRGSQWERDRIGLVLGFSRDMVLVFWGEDFPCEEEYPEQLEVL